MEHHTWEISFFSGLFYEKFLYSSVFLFIIHCNFNVISRNCLKLNWTLIFLLNLPKFVTLLILIGGGSCGFLWQTSLPHYVFWLSSFIRLSFLLQLQWGRHLSLRNIANFKGPNVGQLTFRLEVWKLLKCKLKVSFWRVLAYLC